MAITASDYRQREMEAWFHQREDLYRRKYYDYVRSYGGDPVECAELSKPAPKPRPNHLNPKLLLTKGL